MLGDRMVHIVDDDESIRQSAAFALRVSGCRVATYASGPEFLKELPNMEPGCVLLDVRMPEMSGLDVLDVMNERKVPLPVIIITGHGDISNAVRAMKSGAIDFIQKPFSKDTLLGAVEAGFDYLRGEADRAAAAAKATLSLAMLTPREMEVLEGLARGLTNKAVARDLGISSRTVEVHRAHLFTKLGVRNLPEALKIAYAAGLADFNS